MQGDATIHIVGNLADDPELRYLPTGGPICKFTVLTSPRKNVGGEWRNEEGSPHFITAWNKLAENIAASLKKGNRVMVTATIRQHKFERDGETQYRWETTAEEVGASLKWAEVGVTQMARASRGEVPADDAWNVH